jgi:hypothetical protein
MQMPVRIGGIVVAQSQRRVFIKTEERMTEERDRMKILIAYDGSEGAESTIDDLKRAGLPRRADAVVARLGDSDQAEAGDQVFVVGAPYGLSHTLTFGHLSARHANKQLMGGLRAVEMFQTDAAINSGLRQDSRPAERLAAGQYADR